MEAKEGWRLILKRAEDADCTGLTNSNILIIMRLMFRFYFQSQGCHRRRRLIGRIIREMREVSISPGRP